MSQRSVECTVCQKSFSTVSERDAHTSAFQSRSQQVLFKFLRLQQELLSELNQCVAHQEFVRSDDGTGKPQSGGNNEEDGDKPVEDQGIYRCPTCGKGFKEWKGLDRHYRTHVECYEFCCDRIYKRVSLYVSHKCPIATPRQDSLKRRSEKQLRQSLTDSQRQSHPPKRRRGPSNQMDPAPESRAEMGSVDINEEPRHLEHESSALAIRLGLNTQTTPNCGNGDARHVTMSIANPCDLETSMLPSSSQHLSPFPANEQTTIPHYDAELMSLVNEFIDGGPWPMAGD